MRTAAQGSYSALHGLRAALLPLSSTSHITPALADGSSTLPLMPLRRPLAAVPARPAQMVGMVAAVAAVAAAVAAAALLLAVLHWSRAAAACTRRFDVGAYSLSPIGQVPTSFSRHSLRPSTSTGSGQSTCAPPTGYSACSAALRRMGSLALTHKKPPILTRTLLLPQARTQTRTEPGRLLLQGSRVLPRLQRMSCTWRVSCATTCGFPWVVDLRRWMSCARAKQRCWKLCISPVQAHRVLGDGETSCCILCRTSHKSLSCRAPPSRSGWGPRDLAHHR